MPADGTEHQHNTGFGKNCISRPPALSHSSVEVTRRFSVCRPLTAAVAALLHTPHSLAMHSLTSRYAALTAVTLVLHSVDSALEGFYSLLLMMRHVTSLIWPLTPSLRVWTLAHWPMLPRALTVDNWPGCQQTVTLTRARADRAVPGVAGGRTRGPGADTKPAGTEQWVRQAGH